MVSYSASFELDASISQLFFVLQRLLASRARSREAVEDARSGRRMAPSVTRDSGRAGSHGSVQRDRGRSLRPPRETSLLTISHKFRSAERCPQVELGWSTVCGNADQVCPIFPGQLNRHHWGFDDPAHAQGSDEEVLEEFRWIRDEIRMVLEAYAAGLRESVSAEVC